MFISTLSHPAATLSFKFFFLFIYTFPLSWVHLISLPLYLFCEMSALISLGSRVMLKILQARLQQYMNRELPDVQAGFRKGRRTRDQIANIRWII